MSELPTECLRALDALDATVAGIGDDQWHLQTPCSEWDVRDLVAHLAAESLWGPHMLRGETLADVGDRYDGDVLGDDPRGSWRRAVAGDRAALAAPDVLEARVHTSMGVLPAEEYLFQRLTDLVVHRWDLATAIGEDATIDPDVAAMLYERWEPQADGLAGTGVFGPRVPVPDDAGPAPRLLALLGRQP